MKRYENEFLGGIASDTYVGMTVNSEGRFVLYKEAQSAIDAERTRADRAEARVNELEAECERERMRLAACGAVALANTKETAEAIRKCHPDYESASKGDVEMAVDEQMRLRDENEQLKARIAELEKPKTCEGCKWDLPATVACFGCNEGSHYTPRREGDK